MAALYEYKPNVEARWINPENPKGEKAAGGTANFGRKGSPSYGEIKAGETRILADFSEGPGIIRHIWTTISDRSPMMNRGLRLDIFWDGNEKPAISAPYGDFFGTGLGLTTPFECGCFSNPEGRNANCYIPMPFKQGFKFTITNETEQNLGMFWMQIDFTVGDPLPDPILYLHAHFNRENPTELKKDYTFLPEIKGCGRYLGVNFGMRDFTHDAWWGEGEVKIYLDGDSELPTLCGTGVEDYIGTAWGQGQFANHEQGSHIADHPNAWFCFYRYHLSDPIFFHQSIRATIQQIGCWSPDAIKSFKEQGATRYGTGEGLKAIDFNDPDVPPYGLFERQDDWSSCAYFYLDTPMNELPPCIPAKERMVDLPNAEDTAKRLDA